VLDNEIARNHGIFDILYKYNISVVLGNVTCDEVNGKLRVCVAKQLIQPMSRANRSPLKIAVSSAIKMQFELGR